MSNFTRRGDINSRGSGATKVINLSEASKGLYKQCYVYASGPGAVKNTN